MTAERDGAPTIGPADRLYRNSETLSAEIDGEAVALDVARGACYGLDAVAARIWALIATPTTVADLCEALMATYRVDAETCRRDVSDLLADLRAEGLIRVEAGPPARSD